MADAANPNAGAPAPSLSLFAPFTDPVGGSMLVANQSGT